MEKPNMILYLASKFDVGMAAQQPSNVLERNLLEQIHVLIPAKGQTHDAPLLGISSGKELFEWYLGFFSALSTLGTLGAGFTLSVVVQSSTQANAAGFNPAAVTTWAAVSSMLFVLTVLVVQGCAQLFRFERKLIVHGIDNDDHTIKHCLAALSLLLEVQVFGAFFFLELVLTAHVPAVGWVGIGVTSMLALIALYLWALQATRQWPATPR